MTGRFCYPCVRWCHEEIVNTDGHLVYRCERCGSLYNNTLRKSLRFVFYWVKRASIGGKEKWKVEKLSAGTKAANA